MILKGNLGVINVIFAKIFDVKVIYIEAENGLACFMFSQSRCSRDGIIALCNDIFKEFVVCKDCSFLKIIHVILNAYVHVAIMKK